MNEKVILVNKFDLKIGTKNKIDAHISGDLHRAFSIIIYKKMYKRIFFLLQKRSSLKYHSPLLWSNSCCSHPRPGEKLFDAANRRLLEEFGFSIKLKKLGEFIYKENISDTMTENEFDHILIGEYDGCKISPNKVEICDYKWVEDKILFIDIVKNIKKYTAWMPYIVNYIKDKNFLFI